MVRIENDHSSVKDLLNQVITATLRIVSERDKNEVLLWFDYQCVVLVSVRHTEAKRDFRVIISISVHL